MQVADPHVLAVMHGQEPPYIGLGQQEEPAMFFFVIFGLAYEALASSSLDPSLATSTRKTTLIAALQALKSLMCPEYSGRAFLDMTTCDEFISLCYRMALTEAPGIQVHLVELLSVFAKSQSQRNRESDKAKSAALVIVTKSVY